MDYKLWILHGHYQGTRNFTFESLEAAKNRRLNWRNRIALCYQKDIERTGAFDKILSAMNENLNSAEACAVIDNSELSFEDWQKIDELFGLRLIETTPNISEKLYNLIREREEARINKDFEWSDKIRDELLENGIEVKDTKDGSIWQYK
jgi:cysteinyl-tRNA synthetase